MTVLIIFLGIALAASLAFNFGLLGATPASPTTSASNAPSGGRTDEAASRGAKSEPDLEKKKKELDELRKNFNELKDELKTAKKKLHDFKEEHKTGDDLSRARGEVERQASIQLESTRAELATALSDLQRLRADIENKGRKKPERAEAAAEKPVEKSAEKVERPQEVVTRVIRELSEVEKERIARLEAQSASDRKKAAELEREVRAMKAKTDRHHRESKHVFGEANLARDKFRAVEIRLNRTLLEADLLRRAVADLEKKTGAHAEHAQPTPDEVAASDLQMREKYAAEDKASAEVLEKLRSAPVTNGDESAAEPAVAAAPTPSAPSA